VAFGFDFVPDFLNLASGANENAAAHDSHVRSAHEFLGAPGTVGRNHPVRGVAEQKKIQFPLSSETLQQFHRVRTGANDHHAVLVKFRFCVTKLGRFDGSTRGIRFGKKEDQEALSLEASQRNFFPLIGTQCKVRRFVADFEHGVLVRIRITACEAYR
jgi:hypothetical protein